MEKNRLNGDTPRLTLYEVACNLAAKHFELESGITRIFRIQTKEPQTQAVEPIRLLEVNENTVPSGIMPLQFAASGYIPYPSVIVEVTPDEFEKIKSQDLKLPDGWELGEEFSRPAAEEK